MGTHGARWNGGFGTHPRRHIAVLWMAHSGLCTTTTPGIRSLPPRYRNELSSHQAHSIQDYDHDRCFVNEHSSGHVYFPAENSRQEGLTSGKTFLASNRAIPVPVQSL